MTQRVQAHPERPNVGGEGVASPLAHLRRQVIRSSAQLRLRPLTLLRSGRQSKVRDLRVKVRREQNVAEFEVAVNYALSVDVLQAPDDLAG